jgi:glycosyltransferase involved in cell wall biosynthesis
MRRRLLINGTILNTPGSTGLGVYSQSVLPGLVQSLLQDNIVDDIVLLGRPERLNQTLGDVTQLSEIRMRPVGAVSPLRRLLDLNRVVRAERNSAERTVFYSPTHHGVLLSRPAQVITIHDLFAKRFPQNYRAQSMYFNWYVPRLLRHCDAVIADSQSTADDLQVYYTKPPPAEVVHLAVREDLKAASPEVVPECSDRSFFLFVGPSFPYKNCERLIEAYAEYRGGHPDSGHALVFAGGRDPYVASLRSLVAGRHPGLVRDIVFPGYVSTAQLSWLYSRARALMMTTLFEGFGLPALEAMQCGCPVVAANVGALPEICGRAALFVDPKNINQMAGTMARLADDESERTRLAELGRQNIDRFSWERTISGISSVIRKSFET